ncbi:MAG: methyl-accepting chemotaxis protein, partial [Campylobacterota bacterium]|nr:methyl-accepting chemotaxis protein [Campylobacterota bacterium]
MLKNFSIKSKLYSLVVMFLLFIAFIIGFISYELKNQQEIYASAQKAVQTRGLVVGTLTNGLQITSALRGIYINNNDLKTLKNMTIALESMDKNIDTLNSEKLKKFSQGIEKFNIISLHKRYSDDIKKLISKFNNKQLTAQDITTHIVQVWRPFKKGLKAYKTASKKKDIKVSNQYKEQSSSIIYIILVVVAIGMVIVLSYMYILVNNILTSTNNLQNGLISFFDFLNGKTSSVKHIDIIANDELGKMSILTNNNMSNIQKSIQEDRVLIDNIKDISAKIGQGWFADDIKANTSNPTLLELKDTINNGIKNLRENIRVTYPILDSYVDGDYRQKLDASSFQKDSGLYIIIEKINNLTQSMTTMLVENKSTGLTLQGSANTLLENVESLNKSSNEAASSLEETAAAIEEIRSNVSNSTQNVVQMASYAKEVTSSAKQGQNLANQTTTAMDEINTEVTAISEAITVIDQIAFQTNILSL